MVRKNRESEKINPKVCREKFELIFDPNLSVIMVFSSKGVNAQEKASANHSSTNVQKCNLARIKHFFTRESSHGSNLRERMIKIVSSYRN